jgi:AcrR family transcriptional regulator
MGRRARVSRDEVLRAAREAFGERGYEGTTLAAIATRVGLSPAALLRHAPNKEALFVAALAPDGEDGEGGPTDFLERVPGSADPGVVLGRLAEQFIPFFEKKIGPDLVRYLHLQAPPRRTQPAPDPRMRRRGFRKVVDYMGRARRAGRLEIKDPEAAAMAFMGSLVAYVFLHRIARIVEPPLPLGRYLENLLSIWRRGAIRNPGRKS